MLFVYVLILRLVCLYMVILSVCVHIFVHWVDYVLASLFPIFFEACLAFVVFFFFFYSLRCLRSCSTSLRLLSSVFARSTLLGFVCLVLGVLLCVFRFWSFYLCFLMVSGSGFLVVSAVSDFYPCCFSLSVVLLSCQVLTFWFPAYFTLLGWLRVSPILHYFTMLPSVGVFR